MLNPHTAKVLIWFGMSAVICLSFWVYYNRHLRLARKTLASMEDAQYRQAWNKEIKSLNKQRNICMILTPGAVAIIVLLFVY